MSHEKQTPLLNPKSEPLDDRYGRIERLNEKSFYMTDPDRPFDVFMSVASIGSPRIAINSDMSDDDVAFVSERNKAARIVLSGNMSTVNQHGPRELSVEDRVEDAKQNMNAFITSMGIRPGQVRTLNPDRNYDTPLQIVDIDAQNVPEGNTEPVRLESSGDFIYTYNPDIVLGVRPADCPLVIASAQTPKGEIHMMVHFAWKGAAVGGMQDMAQYFDELRVDRETLRIYVTPGGHSESFPYTNYPQNPHEQYPGTDTLFTEVEKSDGGWSFNIDTPNFVYQGLLNLGLDPDQIFLDTSDTSSLESGYSSHGRSVRQNEDNSRDLVLVQFRK